MSTLVDFTSERLALTELSLPVWREDAEYLSHAVAASDATGFIDAHNVLRAGEIIDQIETERQVLQGLQQNARGPAFQRILDLIAVIDGIDAQVKTAYRHMNGLARDTVLPEGESPHELT
jgi:hypothetical protein